MKNLKKLGKVLSTKEQKNVNGGTMYCPPCARKGALGCDLAQCGESRY